MTVETDQTGIDLKRLLFLQCTRIVLAAGSRSLSKFDDANAHDARCWLFLFSAQINVNLWKNRHIPSMKRELALASVLLAAAIFSWQTFDWSHLSRQPTEPENSTQITVSSATADVNEISTRLGTSESTDNEAHELLRETLRHLRTAPPLQAKIDLAIEMFDETFEMQGLYVQAGEGTPNARLELTCGEGENAINVTQIFDGRFYYIVESGAEERTLRFVDLYQVSNFGPPKMTNIAGLKGWFGTGGLVPLLEQLAGAFEFKVVNESKLNEETNRQVSLVKLSGQWRRDSLHQLLRDQIQKNWLEPEVQWDRMPRQLPHQVEITIGREDGVPLFPYKIVFFQLRPGKGKGVWNRVPVFAITTRELSVLKGIDKSQFQIVADDLTAQDMTAEYLARIKMFLYQPAN